MKLAPPRVGGQGQLPAANVHVHVACAKAYAEY